MAACREFKAATLGEMIEQVSDWYEALPAPVPPQPLEPALPMPVAPPLEKRSPVRRVRLAA